MVDYLAMVTTRTIQFFPVKVGISRHFFPHLILGKSILDFSRDFEFNFWGYVDVSIVNSMSNQNLPRTISAIYLQTSNTMQGGHKVLDIGSWIKIARLKCTSCKTMSAVIVAVKP